MGSAFVIAFLLVALAELGDKSQLLLLTFAARHNPLKVLLGTAIAVSLLQFMSVAVGSAVGALLPERLIAVVAGVLFVGFGIATWRAANGDEGEDASPRFTRFGPVLTVAAALLLAEFGDKTQLMTVSIAADPAAALRTLGSFAAGIRPPEPGLGTSFGVWLGSSLGFIAADAIAIVVGAVLGARLPARLIARVSAVVFVLFGVVTLASAFVG